MNQFEKRNLILFSLGKAISLFGTAIFTFATGLYLLKTTGSGITFATNIMLYTIPMVIISPIAGVIADKLDKRKVVVGSDLLNGLFVLSIFFLINKFGLTIASIYFTTFIMTILSIFFNVSIESSKPRLVNEDHLVKINSVARIIESGSYILGPMTGGLIYAFVDIKLLFLLNALSFIIAAAIEMFINYDYNVIKQLNNTTHHTDLKSSIRKKFLFELKEGYRYIYEHKNLQSLVFIFVALNLFISFTVTVPVPYLLTTFWNVDSSIYGVVQGGLPIGMLIGALFVNKVLKNVSYNQLLFKINFFAGFAAVVFGLPLFYFQSTPNQLFVLVFYTGLMIMVGIMSSWVDIPLNVLLQKQVPNELLGRVLSVLISLVKIVVPIGLILSGYLLNYLSPLYLFIIGALFITVFNTLFFKSTLGKEFHQLNHQVEISKKIN